MKRRRFPRSLALLLVAPAWAGMLTGCPSAQDIIDKQTASNVPVISQVVPQTGKVGSALAVIGSNFGDSPGTLAFKNPVDGSKIFGKIDSWSSTMILTEVPAFPVTTAATEVGLQTADGRLPTTFPKFTLTN